MPTVIGVVSFHFFALSAALFYQYYADILFQAVPLYGHKSF